MECLCVLIQKKKITIFVIRCLFVVLLFLIRDGRLFQTSIGAQDLYSSSDDQGEFILSEVLGFSPHAPGKDQTVLGWVWGCN